MSDYKTISILITALGGEGGGTLMNWILECARSQKLFVQGTSVPGVAQRTGSTSYYIEICDKNFELTAQIVLEIMCAKGAGHIGFPTGLKFNSAHPLICTNIL